MVMRKTKIICTLTPATESAETLREMVEAGANVFRLNMSHATHGWRRVIVPRIRAIAKETGHIIGILMGDVFGFTVRGSKSGEVYSVGVNYDGLIDDISVGDIVAGR
jgi:pyruvate kinase